MKKVIVLIPVYKSQLDLFEKYSVGYSLNSLSNREHVYFVAPENINQSFYTQNYPFIPFIFFDSSWFESIQDYNRLCLNHIFYERFNDYEFLLILQTDAIILRDELDYWSSQPYDYIGAPWPEVINLDIREGKFRNNHKSVRVNVGNGGLSLRRVKKCISLLSEFEDIIEYIEIYNEDVAFSIMGALSKDFVIPNEIVASRFSLEQKPEYYYQINGKNIPMAGHAWWKFEPEFWSKYLVSPYPIKISNQKLIVILGMHRSGTSVLTRALKVFNIDLGNNLSPPLPDNPKGFWEDIDIYNINVEILRFLNIDWYSLVCLNDENLLALHNHGYYAIAIELLRHKIGTSLVFGIKEPRLVKLLPFWKQIFTYLDLNISYVVAIRNPLSVVKSLGNRNKLSPEISYMLWISYNLNILKHAINEDIEFVDYDFLIQDASLELKRVESFLNLNIDAKEFIEFNNDFLDTLLRHSNCNLNDLINDEKCPPLAYEIYFTLQDMASVGFVNKNELNDKICYWYDTFNSFNYSLALIDSLAIENFLYKEIIESYKNEINEINIKLDNSNAEKLAYQQIIFDCNNKVIDLSQTIDGYVNESLSSQQTIVELNNSIAELTDSYREENLSSTQTILELNNRIADLNLKINMLYLSYSWRLMTPFRIGSRPIRRFINYLFNK